MEANFIKDQEISFFINNISQSIQSKIFKNIEKENLRPVKSKKSVFFRIENINSFSNLILQKRKNLDDGENNENNYQSHKKIKTKMFNEFPSSVKIEKRLFDDKENYF